MALFRLVSDSGFLAAVLRQRPHTCCSKLQSLVHDIRPPEKSETRTVSVVKQDPNI